MSHCVICLDEGTSENPLIRPCRTCNIETHQECILNLISTHLISERFILRNNLQYLLECNRGEIIQSENGILLNDNYYNLLLNCTAFDNKKSFYLKYFRRGNGIINLNPPSFSIKNILDVIYIRDSQNPMIYLNDLCPQCKQDITFVSPIRNISFFKNSLAINDLMIIIIKEMFKIKPINLIALGKHLLHLVTLSSSLFPWLYLDRNFMVQPDDYYDNIEELPQFDTIIDPICLAVETTFSIINGISIYRLIYLTIKRNDSLLSYMKFLKLFIKHVHRGFYAFTFNLIYLKWTLNCYLRFEDNLFDDEAILKLRNMSYTEKIIILLSCDFKDTFYNTWNSKILETDTITILPLTSLDSSFDSPFDAIYLTLIGSNFGDKILSRFKPLTKLIYKFFKKFKPIPIEIEMIFEYLGYEVMLFVKTIYEFLTVYSKYRSFASYRVIKSIK